MTDCEEQQLSGWQQSLNSLSKTDDSTWGAAAQWLAAVIEQSEQDR